MSKKEKRKKDKEERASRRSEELVAPVSEMPASLGVSPAATSVQSPPADASVEGAVSDAADSDAPPTRRSTPHPPPASKRDVVIPKLRPFEVDERFIASADDREPELDGDGEADVAPIGPTEYGARASSPPDAEQAPRPPAQSATVAELEQQIRDLESRLDTMIGDQAARSRDAVHAPVASKEVAAPPAAEPGTADLFASDFYVRQWGRIGMRRRTEDVDDFGHDPKYEARFIPTLDFLCKHYFRVETSGAAQIPEEGRCLIVANHSGGPLPYDGLMLRAVLRREHPSARELRWLAEDFIYYLPFVGAMMNRLGAVRACQENAERLLASGKLVAVFPEGAKGIGKLYRDRYRLQRFGRGGFIRLCLRTQTPLVPCAIVGAEEANPMLFRIEAMAKTLGIPYLPVTPTFPALGPLGLLPAPTKWRVHFGEPMRFDEYGPEAADDEILVGRLSERVRTTIQGVLDRTVAQRTSVWFG